MSLRNLLQELEYDVPHGLDTTTPVAAIKPGYCREAWNVNIGYDGGYTKREGYTSKLTGWTGKAITAGIEFKTTTGINRQVIFGTTGLAAGGVIAFNNGGVISSSIATGLSGTARPVFTQFYDLLFFYNGSDSPLLYDGTSSREVGITAPSVAPSISSQAGGGDLTQTGSYVWAYTYYNSQTGAESSPSPYSSSVTLTGTNDKVNLGVTAGDSQYADVIRVYRTIANQAGPLYLDGETSISATTYVSTVTDAGLGDQMELDNSRIEDLTSTVSYPTNIQNRIFVKSGNNEIRWSKIGANGPMPESFEVKATTRTISAFGSANDIVGTNQAGQVPIVLKQRSVGRLAQIGIPDNGTSTDNVIYEYQEISTAHGAVSHFAAVSVFEELLYLGKDNVYATDGVRVRAVADSIKATIKALGFSSTQTPRISSINDVQNSRVQFQVFSTPTAANPDMIIVGDYQLYPEFRWTFYGQVGAAATFPGIQAGCFFHVTDATSGALDVYFGNSTKNGKLYQANSGDSDDGSAIYMRLVTRPYACDSPLKQKLFKLGEIQVQGNTSNYNLTVSSIWDLSGNDEDGTDFPLQVTGYVYDDVNTLYDSATYSDESIQSLDYTVHRLAKFMQLVFEQTDANAPINLFAWGVAASAMGMTGR